jgi:hypothetical protein
MRRSAIVVLAGLFIAAGCGQARPLLQARSGSAAQDRIALAAASMRAVDKPETQEPAPAPVQRKLISNGTVTLDVDSVEAALSAVRASAESFSGYISTQSESRDTVSGPRASLTCRVPAGKLDSMLERLKALGRLRDVTISADDITEQYFDMEVRIRNAKRLEARLVDLLGRPANNLADLLNVERELARVRGELDQLEGKQRFWDKQVAFSTLTINIQGPRPALAADEGGVVSTLKHAVTAAGENFVLFVAGVIAAIGWLVPLGLTFAVGFWLLRRLWRMVRGRRPAKA